MNISIGEKKVSSGAAPRYKWLEDYHRCRGVTGGKSFQLRQTWLPSSSAPPHDRRTTLQPIVHLVPFANSWQPPKSYEQHVVLPAQLYDIWFQLSFTFVHTCTVGGLSPESPRHPCQVVAQCGCHTPVYALLQPPSTPSPAPSPNTKYDIPSPCVHPRLAHEMCTSPLELRTSSLE